VAKHRSVESTAYSVLRTANDIRAIRRGRIGRRIARRAYGRAAGRIARRLFG
jgi:hypothetical protein